MGMFDNDLGKPFTEHFTEGEIFRLENITVGPIIQTSFGDSRIVFLTIEGERYGIFGAGIVNQARNMDDNDLPAMVKIATVPPKKKGRSPMKVIVPADAPDTEAVEKVAGADDIPF